MVYPKFCRLCLSFGDYSSKNSLLYLNSLSNRPLKLHKLFSHPSNKKIPAIQGIAGEIAAKKIDYQGF